MKVIACKCVCCVVFCTWPATGTVRLNITFNSLFVGLGSSSKSLVTTLTGDAVEVTYTNVVNIVPFRRRGDQPRRPSKHTRLRA